MNKKNYDDYIKLTIKKFWMFNVKSVVSIFC